MRFRRNAVLVAAGALLLSGLVGPTAGAATATGLGSQDVESDPAVAAARASLQKLQDSARSVAADMARTVERQAEVAASIVSVAASITDHETRITELVAQQENLTRIVRDRAVALYVRGSSTPQVGNILTTPAMKRLRGKILGLAASRHDDDVIQQLKATGDQLAAEREQLRQQQESLAGQQQELAALRERQQVQQGDLAVSVGKANDYLALIRKVTAIRLSGGEPVLGDSALTAAQLAGWWRSRGYGPPSVSVSIDTLAQLYIQEGADEHVRGDLAFAQAVVETAGFRFTAPGNNFAGMGWCDSCSSGREFPTPQEGVRAQIQHLKNYADITSRASGLRHPASVYWYAPTTLSPAVAAANFDSFFAKGWASSWNDMGKGNWATDPNYAGKVIGIYNQMLAYARV